MQVTVVDLTALGLPPIEVGTGQTLTTDTTEIIAALDKGVVTFGLDIVRESGAIHYNVITDGLDVAREGGTIHYNVTTNTLNANGMYFCYFTGGDGNEQETISIAVGTGIIIAAVSVTPVGGGGDGAEPPTAIDISEFDANGTIVETYADGTSKTTTMEFDDKGNPTKVTDGDGNVTELTGFEMGGGGGGSEYEIPTFNLVELGLPTIVFGGGPAAIETDTTEIITALKKGAVKFIAAVDEGNGVANVEAIMNGIIMPDDSAMCSYLYGATNASVTLVFVPGMIFGVFTPLSSGGGGGVSSWNDLTDKPFGEEADGTIKQLDNKYLEPFEGINEEDLLPRVVSQTFLSDLGVYAISSKTTEEMFWKWQEGIEGNVFVEFDGVVYECAPQRLAAMDNGMAVGNCTAFGGVGNNEPFIALVMPETNANGVATGAYYWAVAALTDTAPTEHTVRVFQPLGEPKYMLKESCLPFNAIAAYIDNYIDEALGGDY